MSTLTPRKQQGQVQYSTLPLFSELEKEEAQAPEPPPLSPGCKVVVSVSGGKDSIASLLLALEIYGRDRVIAHHQRIPEDWPGTLEYIQEVCKRFRIELFVSQAHYTGYRCANCQVHYLTSENQKSSSRPVTRLPRAARLLNAVSQLNVPSDTGSPATTLSRLL